jgi:hypothetical protein
MPIIELIDGQTLPTAAPVAIIRPSDGEPWVLATGLTGVGEFVGTPDPDLFCIAERYGRVIWVNAHTREQFDQGELHPVHVAAAVDQGLLLIAGSTSITALGVDGLRWEARGLVGEDVHITRSDGDRVYFRGLDFDGDGVREARGSLDARTGEVL